MVSYSSSTILSGGIRCNGLLTYSSNSLIYMDYNNSNLYSISASSNSPSQLGSDSAGISGSIGIYGNNIYIFSATGNYYNYYNTVDAIFADTFGSGKYNSSLGHVKAIGNIYLQNIDTAYVGSTYKNDDNCSYIYKITNITEAASTTLSANEIITFSTGTVYNIGGVTSDGTYLYVVCIEVGTNDVNIMKFNISYDLSSPLTLTSGNYSTYLLGKINSVTSPERCDCYYFDNSLYVMVSSTSITKIYYKNNTGSIAEITTDADISSESNTFTVGKSGYGLKFFIATGASSGYNSTNNGDKIIKLYPSTATVGASVGGDPHIKPLFSDTTYIIPNTLECYNYFDSLDTEKNERFVINAKLWTIDYNFIANMTDINDELNIHKYIKYDNILQTDSGFNRYISLIYKLDNITEYVVIDMESLHSVTYDNVLVDKYELKNSDEQHNLFNISEIVTLSDKYKMSVILNTNIFGIITITFTKYKHRKNHRNDFDIVFENNDNFEKTRGVIINEKMLNTVPNLLYVENNADNCNCIKMPRLDEHKQLIKASNLPKMKKLLIKDWIDK